ncbi:hypothetical protein L596_030147 [Steinernema carpocapsae]|uniref:Uncharacterized protein n=1 Tax=Steinernema carpocapsae TaxID=34508 RepID=A0A4U5LRV3_STECR|nr:hypothetical protein L596_030147 [Steinernema carpocapsae]
MSSLTSWDAVELQGLNRPISGFQIAKMTFSDTFMTFIDHARPHNLRIADQRRKEARKRELHVHLRPGHAVPRSPRQQPSGIGARLHRRRYRRRRQRPRPLRSRRA